MAGLTTAERIYRDAEIVRLSTVGGMPEDQILAALRDRFKTLTLPTIRRVLNRHLEDLKNYYALNARCLTKQQLGIIAKSRDEAIQALPKSVDTTVKLLECHDPKVRRDAARDIQQMAGLTPAAGEKLLDLQPDKVLPAGAGAILSEAVAEKLIAAASRMLNAPPPQVMLPPTPPVLQAAIASSAAPIDIPAVVSPAREPCTAPALAGPPLVPSHPPGKSAANPDAPVEEPPPRPSLVPLCTDN